MVGLSFLGSYGREQDSYFHQLLICVMPLLVGQSGIKAEERRAQRKKNKL